MTDDHWKLTAAYLASCHAATLEGLPKSVSKRERERFKSICRKAARFLREPEAAQWWADWEAKFRAKGVSGDGAVFRKGQPYDALIAAASHPELLLGDEADEDIPCSCAVGGYRAKEDEE
jgi:hypothetical protein